MESGLLKYSTTKLMATVPACFLTLSVGQYEIIYGIIFMVVLDTILGSWVALKFRRFRSSVLGRMTGKVGKYGIAMASVWILTAVEPEYFSWAFNGMGIFIMLTEILSNFEKLALLGMKLPTKLIAKLNQQYEKLIDDRDHAEQIIKDRDCLR
jgi:phage-related holin